MSGMSWCSGCFENVPKSGSEPTLAPGLLEKLFGCQANEKVLTPQNIVLPHSVTKKWQPSIQGAVSSVCENGMLNSQFPRNHTSLSQA
jgi:hypothetical protein